MCVVSCGSILLELSLGQILCSSAYSLTPKSIFQFLEQVLKYFSAAKCV